MSDRMDEQLFGGRYRAAALLGRGSSGAVWAAEDAAGGWSAVRILEGVPARVEQESRLRELASALESLDHPHLVRVHEVVTDDDRCLLVSTLVEGTDLRSRLTCAGTIVPAQVARWGAEVAGALAAIHDAGLAHGDVRLENVLLDAESESAMLGDTALVEIAGGDPGSAELDLYHLGAVLYELSCGRAPFEVGRTSRTFRLLAVPARPEGVPDGLWDVIVTLLTGTQTTAAEIEDRLITATPALVDVPAAPPAPTPSAAAQPIHRTRWRRRVVVAGATALAGALLGGGVAAASLFGGGDAPPGPTEVRPTIQQVEVLPGSRGASNDAHLP